MSYVIVLADKTSEANAYAKHAGLLRGRFRFATSASSIRGLRVAEVHELPSFASRRDRHAIDAELRYVKGTRKIVEPAPAADARAVDQGDGMGEQLTIDDALRDANANIVSLAKVTAEEKPQWQKDLDAVLEPEGWEPPESLTAMQVLALAANQDRPAAEVLEESSGEETGTTVPSEDAAPAAPKRRRTRCADCNELDFKGTHSCPVALRPAPVDFFGED